MGEWPTLSRFFNRHPKSRVPHPSPRFLGERVGRGSQLWAHPLGKRRREGWGTRAIIPSDALRKGWDTRPTTTTAAIPPTKFSPPFAYSAALLGGGVLLCAGSCAVASLSPNEKTKGEGGWPTLSRFLNPHPKPRVPHPSPRFLGERVGRGSQLWARPLGKRRREGCGTRVNHSVGRASKGWATRLPTPKPTAKGKLSEHSGNPSTCPDPHPLPNRSPWLS